jgi:hypothetical protein
MHGIIHLLLKKFLDSLADAETVKAIYQESGQYGKFFDATKNHPDEALLAILTIACQRLKIDPDTALEEFGKFITPNLLNTYRSYIKPEWKCLDLLENIETTIHRTVRMVNPDATPPSLVVTRITPTEIRIEYTSQRKMISLGIGIVKKLADHYKENLSITKSSIPNGTRLTVTKV